MMVMEKLGPDLQSKYRQTKAKDGRKLNDHQLADVAVQLINLLKDFHGQNLLHRDIKPENILFGTGENKHKLYLIDYGLAKLFIKNGQHIKMTDDKDRCVGTEKFMSIAANSGKEQGRKDDLESFGYVLVELGTQRTLPWVDYRDIHK